MKVRISIYAVALLSVIFGLLSVRTQAQDLSPIRWTIKRDNSPVKAGDTFKVEVVAAIDDGWHLYSIDQPAGGPIPTRITVPENQKFKLAGEIESPPPQIAFDTNFNLDTQIYEGEVVFTLPIEASKDVLSGKNTLSVTTFFQTCNDKTCLPPKTAKLTLDLEVMGRTESTNSAARSSNGETAGSKAASTAKSSGTGAVEFDFVDFTGKPRKISEFRGKFVLLDFWATWCKPCLADIPKLKDLYEKHKPGGFEIVGMDAETLSDDEGEPDPEFARETSERARQIVSTRGVTWTQASTASAVLVAKSIFGVKSLPTKVLLNGEGKIIATIKEKDDLNGIIERLLKAEN